MAQTAAWLPLSPSPDSPMSTDPRPNQDLTRWELAEILKSNTVARDRNMALDAQHAQHAHHSYNTHFDPSFDPDKLNLHDDSSPYDLFASQPHPSSFLGHRLRSNTSPAAPSYSMPSDQLYTHPPFGDSVPSFHSQNNPNPSPYDMINSLSSSSPSYPSGKLTPLTPNDSLAGLHPGPFNNNNGIKHQDYSSPHPFSDLLPDRRLSSVSSNSYQSDMHDDLALAAYGSSYHDRLAPRAYPPDSLFAPSSQMHSHSAVHPHGHPQSPDLLRGVAPQATHFRPDNTAPSPYDDLPGYIIPNPQTDLALRMPAVDDIMRMRLHSSAGIPAATDLHTFIRCAPLCLPRFSLLASPPSSSNSPVPF